MNYVFNKKMIQCLDAHGIEIKADITISESFGGEETSFIIKVRDLFSLSEELSILLTTDLSLSFLPALIYQEMSDLLIIGLQNRTLFIDVKNKAVIQDVYLEFPLFYIYYVKENNSYLLVTECEVLNYSCKGERLHSFCPNDIITETLIDNNQLRLKTDSKKTAVVDLISWTISPLG